MSIAFSPKYPDTAEAMPKCKNKEYGCRIIMMLCTYLNREGEQVEVRIAFFETKPWAQEPFYPHDDERAAQLESGELIAEYAYFETGVDGHCDECPYRCTKVTADES